MCSSDLASGLDGRCRLCSQCPCCCGEYPQQHGLDHFASRPVGTRSLRFGPPLTDDEICDRQCLWICLGLEPGLVDLMSATLQFRWSDGQLTITEELRGTDCVGLVATALLSIWRFRQFTESRWLQTGTTGRALTAAHLTGLPHLVQQILCDPSASKYFLGLSQAWAERARFHGTRCGGESADGRCLA